MCVQLTPDGHEAGEEDGGGVVKQVGETRVEAAGVQAPVAAALVTQRTHGEVTSPTEVTDLLTETRSTSHSADHTADTW